MSPTGFPVNVMSIAWSMWRDSCTLYSLVSCAEVSQGDSPSHPKRLVSSCSQKQNFFFLRCSQKFNFYRFPQSKMCPKFGWVARDDVIKLLQWVHLQEQRQPDADGRLAGNARQMLKCLIFVFLWKQCCLGTGNFFALMGVATRVQRSCVKPHLRCSYFQTPSSCPSGGVSISSMLEKSCLIACCMNCKDNGRQDVKTKLRTEPSGHSPIQTKSAASSSSQFSPFMNSFAQFSHME